MGYEADDLRPLVVSDISAQIICGRNTREGLIVSCGFFVLYYTVSLMDQLTHKALLHTHKVYIISQAR